MNQEIRRSHREQVNFTVFISLNGHRQFEAKATNLSPEGLFIKTKTLTIPANTKTELNFSVCGQNFTVTAFVIHGNEQGMGLMFEQPQPLVFQLANIDLYPTMQKQTKFRASCHTSTDHKKMEFSLGHKCSFD